MKTTICDSPSTVSWAIGRDERHVWLVATNIPPEVLARAATLLDDEESRRVASFRFEKDRLLSLVARAALRALLGRYLGRTPRALRFVAGPQGKPALTTGELEFNVSHSGGHVALAISGGGAVGVDIEGVRATSDIIHLAERFFSPREAESVRTATDDERSARFFAYWTAKESVIKAVGGGLSLDLRAFETDPRLGHATPVRNLSGESRLDGWNVVSMPSGIEAVHLALASQQMEMPLLRDLDLSLLE
ncbi:MAG: 4'-phosphopantetheinyl transferase superfamily protein [Thermoanaerobaculia bacterium]